MLVVVANKFVEFREDNFNQMSATTPSYYSGNKKRQFSEIISGALVATRRYRLSSPISN